MVEELFKAYSLKWQRFLEPTATQIRVDNSDPLRATFFYITLTSPPSPAEERRSGGWTERNAERGIHHVVALEASKVMDKRYLGISRLQRGIGVIKVLLSSGLSDWHNPSVDIYCGGEGYRGPVRCEWWEVNQIRFPSAGEGEHNPGSFFGCLPANSNILWVIGSIPAETEEFTRGVKAGKRKGCIITVITIGRDASLLRWVNDQPWIDSFLPQ